MSIDWVQQLRDDCRGRVIESGDPDYDDARQVFYGGFDRRPAAIVKVADADDVARVVTLAAETGVELAVRSGGHSVAGHSVIDGGLVLDLSGMKAIEIDPAGRTAWAEPGMTAFEYTTAVATHGLATGFGDTGSVGIGGITLGGGVGYLVRKHGLTIDDLLAADVVTAEGKLLRTDAETEPDLFWAIRGGGGNFGVAARFQYRLHPLQTVTGGMLLLPATPDVIASFLTEAGSAPDELSTIANVMPAPPMPFVPEEHHGKPSVMALISYAGDPDEGERVLAPFRGLAKPLADMVRTMPYPEIYPPEDPSYRPVAAARTMFVDSVDRSVAETILEDIQASSAQMAVTQLRVLGGALARVPSDATAFAHRGSRIMTNVAALYDPATTPDPTEHEAWVAKLSDKLRQSDEGAYVGFLGDEGQERVRAAYPGSTWDRLREVKAAYDPSNLFRGNQNIPPAETEPPAVAPD
jgi:FAD/FMN-containing dehydrogenase